MRRRRDREFDRERRTMTFAGAGGRDAASVQFHERFRNG